MRARGDGAVEEAGRLTDQFNAAVERAISDIGAVFSPEIMLHRLDVHGIAERAREDPASFGFKDLTTPCSRLPRCEGYLFWDHIHPTTQAHSRLAEAALRAVSLQQQN